MNGAKLVKSLETPELRYCPFSEGIDTLSDWPRGARAATVV